MKTLITKRIILAMAATMLSLPAAAGCLDEIATLNDLTNSAMINASEADRAYAKTESDEAMVLCENGDEEAALIKVNYALTLLGK